MTNDGFPKTKRLQLARDFERVYAARLSARNDVVVVFGAPNELDRPRLGLAVSRRAGGAVVRNRWKRLLREAFRLVEHRLPAIDMVCSPRAPEPPTLQQLVDALPALADRIQRQFGTRHRADRTASGPLPERK